MLVTPVWPRETVNQHSCPSLVSKPCKISVACSMLLWRASEGGGFVYKIDCVHAKGLVLIVL